MNNTCLQHLSCFAAMIALSACSANPPEPTQLGGGDGVTDPDDPEANTRTSVQADASVPPAAPNTPAAPTELINAPTPVPVDTNATVDAGASKVETTVKQDCARTEVSAVDTTTTVPADIVILVDTSRSMQVEAEFVQAYLNEFSQQITDSGVDARVILISTDSDGSASGGGGRGGSSIGICIDPPLGSGNCPDDENLPGFVHITQDVGSNDALNVLIDTFPQWRDHLRPEAIKSLFLVTDDDATDGPNDSAATFIANFDALDPLLLTPWSFNGVFSFTECDDAAAIGEVYKDLVAQTTGVSGDLCLQDFQPVFDKLAEQIVANAGTEIVCEWEVPDAVEAQTFSTELVEVNRTSAGGTSEQLLHVAGSGDCAAGGWYFDDAYNPTRILACASTCDAIQDDAEGHIDVVFGCEVVGGCAASGETSLSTTGDVDGGATAQTSDAGSARGVIACEWALPEPAEDNQQLDYANVNVRYLTSKGFGVLMGSVASANDCATAELGWSYDNPDEPTKIVACPDTCAVVTASATDVQALFGCETKPAVPREVQ